MVTEDGGNNRVLADALQARPRVLLLGQQYLDGGSADSPLAAAFRAFDANASSPYEWWLSETGDIERRAASFARVERTVVAPTALRECLQHPWTAVYTSAIDGGMRALLEIPARRLVQQLTAPGLPRLQAGVLPLSRLYGTVERATAEELPPGDRDALRRRRTVAAEILQYLGQAVSARGHLFIDGWSPIDGGDWLRPRDLAAGALSLDRDQVLLFGLDERRRAVLEADPDLAELLHLGIIRTFESRLPELLARLQEEGFRTSDDEWLTRDSSGIRYALAMRLPDAGQSTRPEHLKQITVPVHEWRRLSTGLTIIEELENTRPLPLVAEEQKQLFRTLCSTGPEVRSWPWLHHVAFRRPVLERIVDTCLSLCRLPTPQDNVVILYGQSGSGKSVLLHLLGLELRRLGLPVLFTTRTLLPVDQTQVDNVCSLLAREEATTLPVFFIYDGTQSDAEYLGLASYLSSRNRKCVIVGSAYPGHFGGRRRHRGGPTVLPVEVSVHLSADESGALLKHVARFTGINASMLAKILGSDVSHFFAALYRLLPDVRRPLSSGLIDELIQGSTRIDARLEAERAAAQPHHQTEMELKLRAALGLALESSVGPAALPNDEAATAARRLIDAVMVLSRLGIQVPQTVALRLIGSNLPAYRSSMREDIIVEHEMADNGFALAARHPLEAEIWVRDRVAQQRSQFDVIRALVLCLRPGEAIEESAELEFAVKSLQAIGPEGREGLKMPTFYNSIAETVTELRQRMEVHPRLLLLEAHAIREWILQQQRVFQQRKVAPQDALGQAGIWVERLDAADEGLRRAIDMVKSPSGGYLSAAARRMLSTLTTERAAVLGFKLGSLRRLVDRGVVARSDRTSDKDRWLAEARSAWREALQVDDENAKALDVACWILEERLGCGGVDEAGEAELLAEWADLLDRYLDMDLPPSQLDRQDGAERTFAARCGDVKRFAAVMDRAAARGSNAMRVLNARDIWRKAGAAAASRYLEENCGQVLLSDRAVLLLYLRVWWESATGLDSLLGEERACLALDSTQWEFLERLAGARLALDGERDHAATHFLRAAALVSLARVDEAVKAFEYLSRLGLGGYRRSRSLILLTDGTGKPRELTAEFQGRRQGATCLAWCDELRTNVRFQPMDHGLMDMRPGTWLGPFHLGLSFRGMYAEPPHRLRDTRRTQRS